MSDPSSRHRYDVFLSHNSADKDAVEAIAKRLVAHGVRPFLDVWHLVPGQPWQEELEKALDQSHVCAVFLGPSGVSPWQNEEMRAALEERARDPLSARVVPVLLPGAVPDAATVPRFLRRLTWCDFRDGLDDARSLRRLLAGVSGEAPGPLDDADVTLRPASAPAVLHETTRESEDRSRSIERALVRLRAKPYAWKRRKLLDRVTEAVLASELPLILRGLPGVGKSTLLAQTALELRREFPDVVAISFDGPAGLEPSYLLEELNGFLTGLGRGVDPRQVREQDQRVTFETMLESFLGIRVLVLLDAVDRAPPPWQARLLADLAVVPTVRVAATVQDRPPAGVAANVMSVPLLSEDEAVYFVREMARVLGVAVDPDDLVGRLPQAYATHPQVLTSLVAHLRDLPQELLLLEGLPEEAQAPVTWIERSLESMDERDRQVLALVEPLSGLDLASTLRRLDLSLPKGFQSSLRLLLARSFVVRAGQVVEVPPLVAQALKGIAPELRLTACEQITRALVTTRQPSTAAEDVLAEVATQVAVHLADEAHWGMVLEIANDDLLDALNTRGHWKEYAVLLRLASRAAEEEGRGEIFVELGCRLARKLLQMGDLAGAQDAVSRVEQLIGPEGDTLEHAQLYSHRALLSWANDDELVLRELLRSRSIRQARADQAGLVVVSKLIGNVHLRRREYAAARVAYEEGLETEPVTGQERHRLETETCLAFCDLGEGEPEAAELRLRGVIQRMQELRYVVGQPKALFGLALARERLGDPQTALAAAREAVSLATAQPDLARAAEVLAWRLETDVRMPDARGYERTQP